MPRPPTARIAFAQVLLSGGQSFNDRKALLECLIPGTTVTRYSRTWRLARWDQDGRSYIVGRIGFEAPGHVEELWDEKSKDFKASATRTGATSRFVLDLRSFRVAFQLRSGRIEPKTFSGNLQALLNEVGGKTYHWQVERIIAGVRWETWLQTIERLDQLSIVVKRPNPTYKGKRVRELVEAARAESVRLVFKALDSSPDGVEIGADFVKELLDHVEAGYGEHSAIGTVRDEEGERKKATWRSDVEGMPLQTTVQVDDPEAELPASKLKEELRDAHVSEPEQEPTDDDR